MAGMAVFVHRSMGAVKGKKKLMANS